MNHHVNKEMSDITLNNTDPLYTLGVASRLSNTPQHSIRQYVSIGLLIPYKTKTNRHLFSNADISRLIWMKKYLSEKNLNFAGIKVLLSMIPCWRLKECDPKMRKDCEAYSTSEFPCWEASNKGKECKNTDCRVCKVYQISETDLDIKKILTEIIP